jgi:thiol-disulfide isomerase/thioredoxin
MSSPVPPAGQAAQAPAVAASAATQSQAQSTSATAQVTPRPRRATTSGTRGQTRVQAERRRRLTLLIGAGTVIVIAIIVIVAVISNSNASGGALTVPGDLNPKTTTLPTGSTMPNFTLSTDSGQQYTLSNYRGKPVLVEFFAVWCPHCQHMAPVIDQLNATYKSKGLQVLAVLANPYGKNYDLSGGTDLTLATKSDIAWYTVHFNPTYPLLIDRTFKVVNEVGANSYPTIYILDKSGKVRSATQGEVPYSQLAGVITTIS